MYSIINIDWDNEAEVDEFLRNGLLLANMPGEEVPAVEFDYSPRFEQWERKILANPFGYVKKKNRPIWQRTLRVAAMLILTCALTLGALMAVNPSVRAAVMRWFVEQFQTHDAYRFTDPPTEQSMGQWYPSFLPAGYKEVERIGSPGRGAVSYFNEAGAYIYFDYKAMQEGNGFQVNSEDVDISETSISGAPAYVYRATVESKANMVMWMREDKGTAFLLISFESCETLIRIAESVELID